MLPLLIYEFTCMYVNMGLCRKVKLFLWVRNLKSIVNIIKKFCFVGAVLKVQLLVVLVELVCYVVTFQ
jgi:hypothetical protein